MSVSPPRDGDAPRSAPGPPPPASEPRCPRCGTPHAPNQEYCLECGLRLPLEATGVVSRLSRAWRSRLGWYPGDWIWPSLLALVIAALAGSGAAAFVARDKRSAQYLTETSPVARVPSTIAPPTRATPTTAPLPTNPATTQQQPLPPPPAPRPTRSLKTWPAGQSGWTVVLQSLPTSNGRPFALAQARAAIQSGLGEVGILDSSHYSSLHPGYYVLFSGIYSSAAAANAAATAAQSHGYPRAYPRRITS
ncbi:MAG TPA: zinc ribbon domain-containing protein [Gaiellaceae bacterium]